MHTLHNIKRDLKETGYERVDWIHRVDDKAKWWAVVNTVVNLRVP